MKRDVENMFKTKQFIAWWIDKSFSKWPDRPIVALFDMSNVGIGNVVCIYLYTLYILSADVIFDCCDARIGLIVT